jgi:uncharacterized LabA/DUF88 family protein
MKVINNILFKDYFNELKEIVYSNNFAWFYQKKTTHYEDDNNFMFGHTLFDNNKINSDFYNKFESIKYFISNYQTVNKIIRMKLNLYTNQGKQIEHKAHYDWIDKNGQPEQNTYIAIINFSTCNGSTVIEDKKIPSKENEMILFSNDKKHYGITQNDTDLRIVLNIVFQ